MTCPGCHANDKGAGSVGHDADCEVMSERVVPRHEMKPCHVCGTASDTHAEFCSNVNVLKGPAAQQASMARNECQLCGSKHDSPTTLQIHYETMHTASTAISDPEAYQVCPECRWTMKVHKPNCPQTLAKMVGAPDRCSFPNCTERLLTLTHGVWHCDKHLLDAGWVQMQDRIAARKRAQAAPASPGAPQIPPEPQDTGKTPAARIRERIAEKRSLYEHYHQHTKRMWEEHDAHGGWDSFINGSEVSNRIDELEWCLAVIEGREP